MNALLAQAAGSATFDELLRVLTLRAGFNSRIVILGAMLLGAAAGIVGAFALLRKRALMGDALSHATLPGVALAFLVTTALGMTQISLPALLAGATISSLLGVLTVQAITKASRLHEDAAIGVVLSVFYGLGVVLLSYIQTLKTGGQGGLAKFILGQTAAMLPEDAKLIGALALAVAIAATLLFKEFRVVCFDREFAGSQGLPVGGVDLLMSALVVVVTVIGLQTVGLILIVALLIIPAAAARFWTERLWVMTVLAALIGALSGYLGASASSLLDDFPAGAVIVLVAGAIFVVSMLAAPARGVIATAARQLRLRAQVAQQHVLRAMYERTEQGRGDRVAIADLLSARSWSAPQLSAVLRLLSWRKRIVINGREVSLTEEGKRDALRVTRNHRLWEVFLVTHADLAASHVDRAADQVEHVLSADLVRDLEATLEQEGRLPEPLAAPASVHPINGAPLQPSPQQPREKMGKSA